MLEEQYGRLERLLIRTLTGSRVEEVMVQMMHRRLDQGRGWGRLPLQEETNPTGRRKALGILLQISSAAPLGELLSDPL
jgi:hypothetical protein